MIPKILHHIWPGNDPFKKKFHSFRESWIKYHPDWTFNFWRLDNLPTNVNKIFYNIKNIEKYNITVKSDILRFLIIYELGGIYVDTDMKCLKSLDEFLKYDFFTGKEDNKRICPSLIGAIPKTNLMHQVISECLKSIKSTDINECNKRPDIFSGVDVFTNVVTKNNKLNNIKIFEPSYFYPVHYTERNNFNKHIDSYTVHYWSGMDDDGWVCNKDNFKKPTENIYDL